MSDDIELKEESHSAEATRDKEKNPQGDARGNLSGDIQDKSSDKPGVGQSIKKSLDLVQAKVLFNAAQKKSDGKKDEASNEKEETVIEFRKVSKIYAGNIIAAENVSFKIAPGEFISLVGPSGAGKSTLIKLLTCEECPTSGKVMVAGRDIFGLKKKELPFFRRKVGIIFQDFKLLPKKTVYENIAFALEVADIKSKEIAEQVPKIIEIVGLTSRAKAMSEELSGGEKQRVSIARALVHKPKLLIADEPTGNLDPVATWEIIELLFKINRQGTIVLLATHDKEVVDSLQRRVITMRDGKIISDQAKGKYIL